MAIYEYPSKFKQFKELRQQAEDDGNIIEFEQAFKDTYEALDAEFDEKVANTGRFIQDLDSDAKEIKETIDALTRRMHSLQARTKWLRGYLYKNMKEVGKDKSGDAVTPVRIRKNGGKAPIVFVQNAVIPDEYLTTTTETNKNKIREELENGKTLPFAHFGERGEALVVG